MRKEFGRSCQVLFYLPPWKDCDGLSIDVPDPDYIPKFTLCGIHCTNEECAQWLMAIAGSEIVRLGENKFEYARSLPAMTIAEWREWEVGKQPWELVSHGSIMTLYFDDYLKARLKDLFKSYDESFNDRLTAVVEKAHLAIDALCAKALKQIEQFS